MQPPSPDPLSVRLLPNLRALPTLNRRLLIPLAPVPTRLPRISRPNRNRRPPARRIEIQRARESVDRVGLGEALDERREVLALAGGAAPDEVGVVVGGGDSGDAEEVEHFDVALLTLRGGVGQAQEDGEKGEGVHFWWWAVGGGKGLFFSSLCLVKG